MSSNHLSRIESGMGFQKLMQGAASSAEMKRSHTGLYPRSTMGESCPPWMNSDSCYQIITSPFVLPLANINFSPRLSEASTFASLMTGAEWSLKEKYSQLTLLRSQCLMVVSAPPERKLWWRMNSRQSTSLCLCSILEAGSCILLSQLNRENFT